MLLSHDLWQLAKIVVEICSSKALSVVLFSMPPAHHGRSQVNPDSF